MTVADIVRGEFLAIQRLFGWPIITLLVFNMLWLGAILRRSGRSTPLRGRNAIFRLDHRIDRKLCRSLVWRSLYHSLHTKRPYRAALRAFLEIAVLPFVVVGTVVAGLSGPIGPISIIFLFVVLERLEHDLFCAWRVPWFAKGTEE